MELFTILADYLKEQSDSTDLQQASATTILGISAAAQQIAALVARGPLAGNLGAAHGDNVDGDTQKELDLRANELIINELRNAPVATVVSEELDEPLILDEAAPLYVAIDPLDGSSNIETNAAVGTIFSIMPAQRDATKSNPCLQPGTAQIAAGYVIYGPQTALILTLGRGTHIFTLDPDSQQFRLTQEAVQIPETTREFAINVSNFRHWDRHVRAYIDDCLEGEAGLRKSNYNMRWVASLVAECQRILSRGGVFLYPGDARKGYAHGRLRLLYEVNPISFLIEQAGGAATDGHQRLLEIQPQQLHQRVPMIFGSRREIARVERYYGEPETPGERSQLFNKRGLFRA